MTLIPIPIRNINGSVHERHLGSDIDAETFSIIDTDEYYTSTTIESVLKEIYEDLDALGIWDLTLTQNLDLDGHDIVLSATTLTDTHMGYLVGQDQTVATTSSPTFAKVISSEIEYSGDISIDAINSVANSTVYIINSDGTYKANLDVENDLTVHGNFTVSGTTTTVNTEEILAQDNQITINYGEVGAGVTAGVAGIRIDRGSETDYLFQFDETADNFQIGMEGSLQPVCTRHDSASLTDLGIMYWDAGNYRIVNSSNLTWNGTTFTFMGVGITDILISSDGFSDSDSVLMTAAAIADKIEAYGYTTHAAVTIGTANGLSLSTQELSLALASAGTNGALSSTDWSTFNGKQNSLTFGIANTNAVQIDSASVVDDEYARFTASGLESRSVAEVLSDIGAYSASGGAISGNVSLPDNINLYIGTGNDITIYHNGTNSFINNATGNLEFNSPTNLVFDTAGGFIVRDQSDSDAELFRITTSTRIVNIGNASDTVTASIYGNVNQYGVSSKLFHDSSTNYIQLLNGNTLDSPTQAWTMKCDVALSRSFVIRDSTNSTDYLTIVPASGSLISNQNFVIGTGAAGVDYVLTFNGESSDGSITWDEDNSCFTFDSHVNFSQKYLYIGGSSNDSIIYASSSPYRGLKYTAGGAASGWYGVHDFYCGYNGAAVALKTRIGIQGIYNYAYATSTGYILIGSGSSSAHLPMIQAISEHTDYGLYFDIKPYDADTGFSHGALYINAHKLNDDPLSDGNLLKLCNDTTAKFTINYNGLVISPKTYSGTTATAANVNVDSSGNLARSTSSIKYKKNIVDLSKKIDSSKIFNLRCVAFQSKCDLDDKEKYRIGLIAEETDLVLPEIVIHENPVYDAENKEEVINKDTVGSPEGVNYAVISVLLLEEMKKMKVEIDELRGQVNSILQQIKTKA